MYPQHDVVPTSHMHGPSYPSLFPGSFAPQEHWNPAVVHHDLASSNSPFSPPRATYYPFNSTTHAQTHIPFSAHTPQGYPSMLISNGVDPLVSHQSWNAPADYPQQYTFDPLMQSTQLLSWNETSDESGEGNGALGW
ncbi:hypothetical protein AAF712_015350 [Marasmius tenuissimus]|uniref:Uncharacterized protein n=1 Tax=Marasmius tenuissimus TaxID=585030 RepID=A0ABR2ZBX8_9AGAR